MKFKKQDMIVITAVLLLAIGFVGLAFPKHKGNTVNVSLAGNEVFRASLHEHTERRVADQLTVVIENGEVYVKDSICADHICQQHRPISRQSESIVCLPAKIVVSVSGGDEIDAIAE